MFAKAWYARHFTAPIFKAFSSIPYETSAVRVSYYSKKSSFFFVKLYSYTLCTLRIERLNYIRNTSLYDLLTDLCVRDSKRYNAVAWSDLICGGLLNMASSLVSPCCPCVRRKNSEDDKKLVAMAEEDVRS